MEKIKLEEKELKEIKQIREENSRMMVDFGRIKVELIMLRAKLMEVEKIEDDMTAKFKGNQTKENKISEKLKKKYGDGTVNLDEGIFTPTQINNGKS
jgi:regulator of replication initiation timing